MADRKISDLTALTTPAAGDYLPIVDVSEPAASNKNKRITIEELLRGAPDGTAAAPSIAFENDPNTGLFSAGADQLGIATNGIERVEFGTTEVVFNDGGADVDFRVEGDTKPNLLLIDAGNDRIQTDGPIGVGGANFGTAGQVLVSNGSSAAPSWQSMAPPVVFGWNHSNDTYGLYLLGTSIFTGSLSGTVDIDVQSRMRRCVINNSGVVQYYLDANDSTKKAASWLRIVETESLNTAYTGTTQEATNSLLRVGVPAWNSAITFTRGQRVTHSGSLWECLVASTPTVTAGSFVVGVEYVIRTAGTTDFTLIGAANSNVGTVFTATGVGTGTGTARETPQAGTVASNLTGTDGQVMVEIPAFSVRYGFSGGVHTREVRLGCSDSLIAQGFQPHPAFIKTDGTYKSAFYMGAYHASNASGNVLASVSGQSNLVSQTRGTFRNRAVARGTGWHIHSYLEHAAIQTLLVCEYRDHNSQKVVGNGAQEGSVYVVNTGLSNGRGNRSGNAYTVGGNNADYMSYRGIENLWGRAWQWVDGFNFYERVVYLTNNQSVFADDTSVGYRFYAQVPSGNDLYQKEIFPLPDVFLPSVVTGASNTSYLADGFWTSIGWGVVLVGGASNFGSLAGSFALNLYGASSNANPNIGARPAYAVN